MKQYEFISSWTIVSLSEIKNLGMKYKKVIKKDKKLKLSNYNKKFKNKKIKKEILELFGFLKWIFFLKTNNSIWFIQII